MATQKRRIVGGIMQGGRVHVEGDEDQLAKLLSPAAVQRLVDKGQLEGDWSVAAPVHEPEPDAPEPEPTAKPKKAARKTPTARRRK